MIPTERSLNRMIYPVVEKSKGKTEFPVVISKNSLKNECAPLFNLNKPITNNYFSIDNNWDHRNFMVMDIITSKLCVTLFGKYTPIKDINRQSFKKTDKEIQEIINHGETQWVTLWREELRQIPLFNKLSNNRILGIMKNMTNCHLSGDYEYRYYDEVTGRFYHKKTSIENDTLISEVENDKNKFTVYLGSKLSKLYILNIAQMNVDFMDNKVYGLNKYSHLLYRFLLGNNNKKDHVRLNINEILYKINIHNTNPSRNLFLVKKYLNELVDNGLVSNYEIINNSDGKYSKSKVSSRLFIEIYF